MKTVMPVGIGAIVSVAVGYEVCKLIGRNGHIGVKGQGLGPAAIKTSGHGTSSAAPELKLRKKCR